MKYFLTFVIFLTALGLQAQLNDNFTDGNFSANPAWIGDDSVYTVVDVAGDMHLRSNKLQTNSSFYLATPSAQASNAQWELFTNLTFNTSSANYVDIYLMADQSNLLGGTLNGYFVRIGGTTDEISLYRKVAGTAVKIIDGTDGVTNVSNNTLKIKVIRTSANDWTLSRDITGTGTSYFTEGTINDATIATSSFFGISVTQSTASFFQKHFFDDIYVGPIILDVTPPVLISAIAISATQVDVLFDENVDQTSAETIANYDIQPFVTIASAQRDATNLSLVHLTLTNPLTNGSSYQLFAQNIEDIALNAAGIQSTNFSYLVAETPVKGDVILNEFVCDESPAVGLPAVEYVEIYNKSTKYFNIQNWKLGDAASDGTIQSAWLYPGEHKILCSTANVDTFTMTTAVAVTSFPSLNNAGDDIVLKTNSGLELDRISYTDAWYQDPTKADGGYSIERINPNDPCSAADNWKASNDVIGGTPGAQNSVHDITADTQNPFITELIALSPNLVTINFSEGMDSTLLANALVSVNPSLTLSNTYILDPFPTTVTFEFNENLVGSQTYAILLQNVGDCWLNTTDLNGTFVLPENPVKGDIVINEILFDPYTGGYDWIELLNTSNKTIDLKDWQFANYDNDTIDNNKVISNHYILSPGEYVVLGKDSNFVKMNYPATIPGTFYQMDLPSMNVDSSTVFLIRNFQVMDKVSYTSDWHFSLLDVTDGVSLERIDPAGVSDNASNWHSAAEAIGFATPGGKNSQYYPAVSNGNFSFTSETVSPDNDGFEDVLLISYEMTEPGLLGKFTIYDDRGRLIKSLFSNELLATSGTFSWDGVTDKDVKASIGTYVAVFEAFSLDGETQFSKTKAFVVAGKL
ncbi:MAG: hypothetical protein E6Q38_02795 [Crocinitomicaceae bacterium]|nr:MAG: hypothetical protein E6Q38_02795 [Crocinitomicaceae bacterium]